MLILLLIIVFAVWLFSWGGPRYYPAYTTRYRRYPLWGGRSNILLAILGVVLLLWLLGYIHIAGLPSPLATRHSGPVLRVP
ncbi:MAG TPA: hypothetical protein VFD58_23240 [Blastocatellia bacterium]|nr:hypothetical protein [Blastocatellia bacterium]